MKSNIKTLMLVLSLTVFLGSLILFAPDSAAQSDKIPGMSVGSFSVDNNGTASYSIPIIIPPGTAGMAPKLSLGYSSTGQNGIAGIGWSLSGLSGITRCPRTIAQDNVRGTVNFDAGDRYCLDGQRLIVVNGLADGADQAEYRTEIDSFLRVFSYGQTSPAGSGPLYWLVKNKAGQTMEFGGNATSDMGRIEAEGKFAVRVWALSKVRDVSGNYMTITYVEENANGDYRPTRIDYTGNDLQSVSPQRYIELLYGARPNESDVSKSYLGGSLVRVTQRLTGIKTYAPPPTGGAAVLVREYRLAYGISFSTLRSRLTSLAECSPTGACTSVFQECPPDDSCMPVPCLEDGSCLPPHVFGWQGGSRGLGINTWAGNNLNGTAKLNLVGDFNGDGKADIVAKGSPCQVHLFNGAGFTVAPWSCTLDNTYNYVGDFNGDGKADILSRTSANTCALNLSNATGTNFTTTSVSCSLNGNQVYYNMVGDFNGDGRTDIISKNNNACLLHISNGTGFGTPITINNCNLRDDGSNYVGDFDGDGKADIANRIGSTGTCSVRLSTGIAFDPQTWNCSFDAGGFNLIGDFNGDGKTDIANVNNGTVMMNLSKGTGPAFDVQQWAVGLNQSGSNWMGDFDGDGRTDIISKGAGNCTIYYSTGAGFIDIGPFSNCDLDATGFTYLGDFSGDGRTDVAIKLGGGNVKTLIPSGPFPDLLTSISNNLAGGISITYKPLTDSTVYTKENDAVYPVQDVQSSMYVVDNYSAASFNFTYDYTGAKIHVLGRGWLGFHQTIGVDQTAGAQSVYVFRQVDPVTKLVDFPFVGLVDVAQTKDMQGSLFAQVKNTYTSFGTQLNQPKVVFAPKTREVKDQCDAQPVCFTTAQTFEYDNTAPGNKTFGNLVHTLYEGDVSDLSDQRHERTVFAFKASGTDWMHRPINTRLHDTNDAVVREKFLYYDDQPYGVLGNAGLLTKEESSLLGGQGNPGNPTVTYHYNTFGNRDSTTDPLGCVTKTTTFDSTNTFPTTVFRCYGDPNPNLIHFSTFEYDPRFGTKTKEVGPLPVQGGVGPTTSYTFDNFGRLIKVVGPMDTDTFPSETRAYFNWGDPSIQRIQILKTKDRGTNNVISREDYFDGLGRFDFIRSTGPNDPATGVPRIIVDQSFYDSRGLITRKVPSYFDTEAPPTFFWDYTYDVLGRQTRVDHPDDRFSTIDYKPAKVTLTDERGKQKIKYLDGYAQVERIDEINGAETYTTLYEYDAAGLLFHVENHLHHHTRIKYDAIGRKIAMCDPNMGAGPDPRLPTGAQGCDTTTSGAWLYTYDTAGNLKTQKDAKLNILSFDFDSHSRMTKKTYPNSSFITFAYDQCTNGVGRPCQVNDLNGMVTAFTYQADGLVTQTQRTIDSLTYTMSQNYNALGKVIDETFPDLENVAYTYNEAGWLKTVGGYVDEIQYNARGQRTLIDYSNGTVSTFNYFDQSADTLKNFALKGRATAGPSSPQDPTGILQNFAYTYDNVGNVTSIKDTQFTASRNFGKDPDGILPDEIRYDDLNRLIRASGKFGGSNQSPTDCPYTYDAIGNMLSKCGVGYSYTNAMYPSFVTSRSDGKTYAPDTNGNTQSGDGRTFAWTVDNRVASVANGSGTTTMDYDYTGARVKKFGPLGQVLYPFAGYEIGPDGTKTKYFRIGTEIVGAKQTPVSNPEKRLFYHADHLGGTNVITDVNGARVQLIEYDPWGKTSRNEGNGDPERRFTGQILDPESGLYYYGARYYDPELARFISPDPIVPSPGDPQSLNRYSYVRNNPVKYIDPTGHSFWSAIGNFFKNLFRRPEVFFATLIVGLVTGGLAYTFLVPALGIALGSWGAFAVAGAVGGAFAGLTSAGMTGGNLWQGALMGGIAGAVGGAVGGWVGGGEITFGGVTAGAFAGGFVSGGLGTAFNGGNFFQNAMVGAIGSTVVAAAMYGVVKAAGELYQRWKSMPGAAPRASGASDRCIDCSDIVDQDGVQKTGGPSAKPPIGVPGGGPGNDWKWNPDPGNSRGGTWGPQNPLPRQSQPSASWDPQGHWDVDDGFSNRSRYDQNGRYLTPDQAHGRVPIVPAPRFIEPMFPMIIPNVPAFRNFLDSLTGRNNQPI